MKRLFAFICIAAALVACEKGLSWNDPTPEPEDDADAPFFNITRAELSSKAFDLDAISDPGTITEPYRYFSSISWDEWRYLSGEARRMALEVPEEILKQMTTLALVETALNHPELTVVHYAYNYPLAAMDNFVENTGLLRELASRKNAPDVLIWAYGQAAVDPLYLLDPDAAWQNRDYEANMPLDNLDYLSFKAFDLLMTSSHFDFSHSQYLEYFKSTTAYKIAEEGLDLSGESTYFCEPLLILWDKYFGNLAPGICFASYPYVF